jgi:hypothetical protein
MKRMLAGATALVVCFAVPAATAEKPPKQPKQLSISAVPNPLKFGQSVTVSGKLTGPKSGGKIISLREDPFPFGDLMQVATAPADDQGGYSFTRTTTINTRYQAKQGGAESEIVTVLVSPSVSLRLGDRTPAARSRVRFFGKVCPEHDRATLVIQRRVEPDRWRTVRRTTLIDAPGTSCSTYSRRVRLSHDGVWRTVIRAHADHAAGRSRARRVDVH